jgi:hypothetical protein
LLRLLLRQLHKLRFVVRLRLRRLVCKTGYRDAVVQPLGRKPGLAKREPASGADTLKGRSAKPDARFGIAVAHKRRAQHQRIDDTIVGRGHVCCGIANPAQQRLCRALAQKQQTALRQGRIEPFVVLWA